MFPFFLLKPLVGAVIGYITNDIAIRMLFRPRKAKYIFGIHVPFTPGIIPREKARLALSLGSAISKNLMDPDTVGRTLLSDAITAKIAAGVVGYFHQQAHNQETLRQYLAHFLSPQEVETAATSVASSLSEHIAATLQNSQLGTRLGHIIVEHALEKVRTGLLGILGGDQFLRLVAAPAEQLLGKHIDEILRNNSRQIVGQLLDNQIDAALNLTMAELFAPRLGQAQRVAGTVVGLYRNIVAKQLPRMLQAIDITAMIEQRVNQMDERESEKLILSVMSKELRAIVWLGALLGFVMGWLYLL